jgi:hypothetical protein
MPAWLQSALFADGRAGKAVGLSVALARDVRNGEAE